MKSEQKPTNKYYSQNAEEYFKSTVKIDTSSICEEFEKLVKNYAGKSSPLILDAGCGSGRDAHYFKTKKFTVVGMDFSIELLKLSKSGFNLISVNSSFYNLPFQPNVFDGVFANASLLHIPKDRFSEALRNLKNIIKKKGILFFTLKKGSGESVDEQGRFFSYYNECEIEKVLQLLNLRIEFLNVTKSYDGRNLEWLSVACRV